MLVRGQDITRPWEFIEKKFQPSEEYIAFVKMPLFF